MRAFVLFKIKSLLMVCEGNFFLCQVVAQTETRLQYIPMIWVYYLLKVPKEIRFFMKGENNIN